jgi:transposase
MQADFTVIRRRRDRLSAFVGTLGYSRASFVRFTEQEDFPVWRDCLLGAFEFSAAYPRKCCSITRGQ